MSFLRSICLLFIHVSSCLETSVLIALIFGKSL